MRRITLGFGAGFLACLALMRFYLFATVLLCGCVTIEVVPAHQ